MDCDTVNYGCDGGWMMDGYDYVQENGIELWDDYKHSYLKRKSKCYHKKEKAVFKNTGSEEEDEVTNQRLKELVAEQPVAVAMYSSRMLQNYKNGVMTEKYLFCSNIKKEVNHAVVVVGYGKVKDDDRINGSSAPCTEYWVVRNSWGPNWGEEGFFRLCMDGTGEKHMPQGICQVNYYTQRPTFHGDKPIAE